MPRSFALVVLFALAGCRSCSSAPVAPPTERAATDATASAARARSASDGAASIGCASLEGCVGRCAGSSPCIDGCIARLSPAAHRVYDELQACVVPACAQADASSAPCLEPSSFACKMCVLRQCAKEASACLAH